MGHFDMAIEIVKEDLKRLRAQTPRNDHNIERARIVLESLKHGKRIEEKKQ